MQPRTVRAVLLVVLAYVLTMTGQFWLGYRQVYTAHPEAAEVMHRAILENHPPPGKTWQDIGANGTNLRRVSIELAEVVRKASGLPLFAVYFALDTVFFFCTVLLLGVYLSRWLAPPWVALGLLYYGMTTPLTYLFYYSHPWDRLSQLCWLSALFFLRDRRALPFAAVLAFGMAVKYDMLALPLLWAAWTWRPDQRRRWLGQSLAMFAVAVGVFKVLQWRYPAGYTPLGTGLTATVAVYSQRLVEELRERAFAFPPMLMFALPLGLAFAGWKRLSRLEHLSLLFGCALFGMFSLGSNLREVRAQVPILYLVLPAALMTLQRLLTDDTAQEPHA